MTAERYLICVIIICASVAACLMVSVVMDGIDSMRPATEGQMYEIKSLIKHNRVSKTYVQSKASGGINRHEYKLIRDNAYRYVKTKDTLEELGL